MVKDITKLEKVQHRLTRMILIVKDIPYALRLKRLTTLSKPRERSDISETYTIIHKHTS